MEPALDTSAEWIGDHDLYAMLADVSVLQRDLAGIRQFAGHAEEYAKRYGHGLYLAIALRARGVAYYLSGDFDAARTRLEESLAIFRSMDAGWQIGRTIFELGELSRAKGELVRARAHYAEALHHFDRMNARVDATRVRQAMSLAEQR